MELSELVEYQIATVRSALTNKDEIQNLVSSINHQLRAFVRELDKECWLLSPDPARSHLVYLATLLQITFDDYFA